MHTQTGLQRSLARHRFLAAALVIHGHWAEAVPSNFHQLEHRQGRMLCKSHGGPRHSADIKKGCIVLDENLFLLATIMFGRSCEWCAGCCGAQVLISDVYYGLDGCMAPIPGLPGFLNDNDSTALPPTVSHASVSPAA